MGISQAAYGKFEKDDKNVNFERLSDIAKVLEIDPIKLIGFDEKHIFNNTNQQGGNAASILMQIFSEKERELYEARISGLEKEVEFLRSLLKKE